MPALAASFSVGGGTITTTQADNSVDNTGTGGAFELQANTITSGDVVTVSNVNTAGVSVGNLLPTTGSYSVTMQGSTLSNSGLILRSTAGLVSFDSTGGASNVLSGAAALNVSGGSGGVSIKTGADTINGVGCCAGTAISAVASGTVTVDTVGATITSAGLYGIVAQNGVADITIGGLNGGMASAISVPNGYGIFTSSNGNISVTIAPSGSITALDGISISSSASSVDNFGTLAATNNAIAVFFGPLSVTLEPGSTTSGILSGGNGTDTFTIFGGANIVGATFNGNGGNDRLILTGSGNGSFSLASATNIANFQMQGSGIWTIAGSPATNGGWTVASGTLRAGGNLSLNAVTINGGVFDVNSHTVTVGALSGAAGTIALGSGSLSTTFAGTSTLASAINGTGSLTKQASGTLILTGTNTYNGGTTLAGGTLQLGNGGISGSIIGNVSGFGTLSFNRSDTITFGGLISGNMIVQQAGTGTTILTGVNTYDSGTTVTAGKLQLGLGGTLGSGAPLTMNGGTLDLNNTNQTVGSASGAGGFITLGSGILTVTGNNGSPLASIISGSGGVQVGTGQLKLSADNTYTGGTVISGGTLQIGNGGTTGSVVGNIVNNGVLVFNRSDTVTVDNIISGSGPLIHNGTGTLIFTGTNTYTGGTQIWNGYATLQIGNGGTTGSIVGDVAAFGNGIVFNRSDNIVFSGVISGNYVSQIGSGKLTLAGDNTYAGVTTISGGTLQVGNGGTTGTVSDSIADNGALIFNRSDAVSYGGVISGTGTVTQAGSGTLVLTGSNTYSGGTTISGGALQLGTPITSGSIVGNVLNNAQLVLGRSDSYVFAGNISGSGAVSVAGQGTAILTGVNTYSGGTTILSGSTLQIGNGGTSGTLPSLTGVPFWVDNDGTLIFNRSDTSVFHNIVNGSGVIIKQGAGTLIVTGTMNASTITISQGALQFGDGPDDGAFNASVTNNAVLAFGYNANFISHVTNTISGGGTVSVVGGGGVIYEAPQSYVGGTVVSAGLLQLGAGGSLANTGAVTINGGIFDLNGHNQIVGPLSGTGGAIALGGGILTTSSDTSTNLAASISGSGSLIKAGTGTLSLTGTNTYTDGTTISGGALQIGSGGTGGSLTGNVTNNAALIFNRSDTVAFASVISGSGSVAQAGTGTLILSAANSYTGATNVNAGTLNVTGTIASSNIAVANGAILSGTGRVGSTTIASGGTLTPGSSSAPGALAVNGSLTLASGATYLDAVTPAAASLTNVSGTASLNGSFAASLSSGTYTVGQRYTVLTAAGGIGGTFASFTTVGVPSYVKGRLSYDANNVYLNLDPNALAPQLSNATGNQHTVVTTVDAAVAAGNVPPAGFVALYGLSGSALNSALDQISGQVGPNTVNAVGQGFLSFMSMTASGGSGATGSFAPGSAYGAADAPHRAQLGARETRVWGAVYGGHVGLSGDAASGAAGLSSNNVGLIGGADMQVSDGFLAGVTLGLGRQNFRSGNGSGDSDDIMIGLYGRAAAGAAYVAASFGLGWHQIKTQRVITISGTDVLQGKQDADDFGGRIETGWHLPLDDTYTVTPYAAFAGESFENPAYGETALSGASTFALAYAAQTTTLGRSELGAHLDRSYALEQGSLRADVRAAWAHQLDDLPFTQASFVNLPGAAFQVAGVRPASDTALLGLDLEVQNSSGLFFGIHGEGQFGAGTTVVEGLGNFGWRW
jgi:fibronectin-binding autotransporter adhesin